MREISTGLAIALMGHFSSLRSQIGTHQKKQSKVLKRTTLSFNYKFNSGIHIKNPNYKRTSEDEHKLDLAVAKRFRKNTKRAIASNHCLYLNNTVSDEYANLCRCSGIDYLGHIQYTNSSQGMLIKPAHIAQRKSLVVRT